MENLREHFQLIGCEPLTIPFPKSVEFSSMSHNSLAACRLLQNDDSIHLTHFQFLPCPAVTFANYSIHLVSADPSRIVVVLYPLERENGKKKQKNL